MIALVFLGGALGSLARFGLGELWLGDFWLLFTVNALGSFFIGCANAHPRLQSESAKAFVSIGFAGGFTTMSGLAVFMLDAGALLPALTIFACGLAAYWLGAAFVSRMGVAR